MDLTSPIFMKRPTKAPTSRVSLETDDFNATEPLIEALMVLEDQFLNVTRENITAVHYGVREESLEILHEGFSDMLKSSVEFFKKMIEKFKELIGRLFMIITAYIGNFDKFLVKYKTHLDKIDPEFDIKGFNYSIPDNAPDIDLVRSIVSSFNGEVTEVPNMSKLDIMKERDEFTSDTYMDRMRATVMKTQTPIRSENYTQFLREKFRSGNKEEIDIKVNKSVLDKTISDYPSLKKAYKDCVQLKDRTILLIESMKTFFNRGTTSVYTGNTKSVQVHTININNDGSGVNKGDAHTMKDDISNNEKLNLFYSFKLKQAKELGAITVTAVTEKANALKEAVKQSEIIVRKSLFSKKPEDEGGEKK